MSGQAQTHRPATAAAAPKRPPRRGDPQTAATLPPPRNDAAATLLVWVIPIVLVAATVATFWPATANQFVNWDDQRNFLDNDAYRGVSGEHVRWAFTTRLLGVYQPLSWLLLGWEFTWSQLQPFGYHVVSILLHALGVAVFFGIALRVLRLALPESAAAYPRRTVLAAGLAAAAYALHPLRVECVAWVSCQPYVVAMLFFLITIDAYLRAADRERFSWAWFVIAIIAYTCCVLSKAIGVMLPFVLLLLDVYPLRRVGGRRGWDIARMGRLILEKLPFLALAVFAARMGTIATDTNAALDEDLTGVDRMMLAFYGLAHYVFKTLVPTALVPHYPLPHPFDKTAWYFIVSILFVFAVTGVLFAMRRRWPGVLAAWVFYVIVLFPVLGIVQHGSQIAADRYAYLSCLVWPVLAAGGLLALWRWPRMRAIAWPLTAAAVVAVLVLPVLVRAQIAHWRTSVDLWQHAIAVDPQSHFAHNNLGSVYEAAGDDNLALDCYERAVAINERNLKAQRNLGGLLNRLGRSEEAEVHLQRALDLDPSYSRTYISLGNKLFREKKYDEAEQNYLQALALGAGDRTVLAKANGNLANVHFQRAGQANEKAIHYWTESLKYDPGATQHRQNLAAALVQFKRYDQALAVLEEGVRVNPQDAQIAANLAWLLATAPDDRMRNGPRAVQLAEGAIGVMASPDPRLLNFLAGSYAEVGRFDDAVKTIDRAIALAGANAAMQQHLQPFAAIYRAGKPYRLPAP